MGNLRMAFLAMPLIILSLIGLFFFVWKMPKDLGIYLGWLPALVWLLVSVFESEASYIVFFVLSLAVYITATVLRIDKNKKKKQRQENQLKEIDKMSIDDL